MFLSDLPKILYHNNNILSIGGKDLRDKKRVKNRAARNMRFSLFFTLSFLILIY